MFCGETAQPLLLASNQLYKIPYVVISKLGGGILNLWFIDWMILRIHSSVLLNIFIHFSLRDKVLPGHGINCRLVGVCSHISCFLTHEIYTVIELLVFFFMPSYPYSMRRSVNDSINVNTFKDVSADVFVYNWGPCKWRPVPYQRPPLRVRTGF